MVIDMGDDDTKKPTEPPKRKTQSEIIYDPAAGHTGKPTLTGGTSGKQQAALIDTTMDEEAQPCVALMGKNLAAQKAALKTYLSIKEKELGEQQYAKDPGVKAARRIFNAISSSQPTAIKLTDAEFNATKHGRLATLLLEQNLILFPPGKKADECCKAMEKYMDPHGEDHQTVLSIHQALRTNSTRNIIRFEGSTLSTLPYKTKSILQAAGAQVPCLFETAKMALTQKFRAVAGLIRGSGTPEAPKSDDDESNPRLK